MAPQGSPKNTGYRGVRLSCEACRLKKIRCPGEHPVCSKCISSGRECQYSPQKPMSRPIARRRGSRRDQLLPRTSSAMQRPPLSREHSAVGTSEYGIGSSSDIGNEPGVTGSEGCEGGSELENFEVHQCLLGLGHHSRAQADRGSESEAAFPPLATTTQPSTGGCACLSVLYLLLENLRVKDHLTAPNDFVLLRSTIESASEVLTCDRCPQRYFSVIQNAAMLGMLCLCVAESYHRILRSIDEEEKRASGASEKKQMDIHAGGTQPAQQSLAETSPFCVEVSPVDWRKVMRNLVRAEVFGVEGQRDKCLKGFMSRLEQRQLRWHHTPPAPDCPPSCRSLCGPFDREPTCLKLIDNASRLINLLDL